MKPTKEDIERSRKFWTGVAIGAGWLDRWKSNGYKVIVWYDPDGAVTDSIYLNDKVYTEDVIMPNEEEFEEDDD